MAIEYTSIQDTLVHIHLIVRAFGGQARNYAIAHSRSAKERILDTIFFPPDLHCSR